MKSKELKIKVLPLAERLFDNQIFSSNLDMELSEFLEKIFPDYDDCSYDYYDKSLEIYGKNVLEQYNSSQSIKVILREVGFRTVYVHQSKCKQERSPDKSCCTSVAFML